MIEKLVIPSESISEANEPEVVEGTLEEGNVCTIACEGKLFSGTVYGIHKDEVKQLVTMSLTSMTKPDEASGYNAKFVYNHRNKRWVVS